LIYLRRFSHFWQTQANPKNLFLAFGAQLILGVFILPKAYAMLDVSGTLPALEFRFGFKSDWVVNYLETIGSKGRGIYLIINLLIDSIYAIIYSISFSLILSYFLKLSFSQNHYFRLFNLFPFVVGIFDLIENVGISALIISFPQIDTSIVAFASLASLAKWGAILYNIIMLFIALFAWIFSRIRLFRR
jgi:hypothetical protein